MDYILDVFGVLGVHPYINLFMGEYDWHSVMDLGELRSGIFGQDDNLVLIRIEPSN